jgi:uncharacterized protein (DUF1800 family)
MTGANQKGIRIFLCAGIFLALAAAGMPQGGQHPGTAAAARFLEQASWGPTPASVRHVQAVGFENYIEEQFHTPASSFTIPAPAANGKVPYRPLQEQFFLNAVQGDDQLRQRVVFALSQIWVVSGTKIREPAAMVNYLQVLQADAFANYRDLMHDVTLSPAMGHYLDMVNNNKTNPASGKEANENYAREFLQLFTIGLSLVREDGTLLTDSSGNPIPTFTQADVQSFARVFTGWTYAPAPGTGSRAHNPPNWTQPIVPWEKNHDRAAKTLLNGSMLTPDQTAEEDLKAALNNVFYHPNTGPFVSRLLIQHLVTGNPSPGYVARVSDVFDGGPSTPRGDMKAVIRAVLLDPEARSDDDLPAVEGHLREPVLFMSALLRGLNANVDADNGLPSAANAMGQNLFFAPSVFNYYSPGYRIPGTKINAPEFQILSTSTAVLRADFVNSLIYGKVAGVHIDLGPFIEAALNPNGTLDPAALLAEFDYTLLGGRMSDAMSNVVMKGMNAAAAPHAKAKVAAYLIGSSPQFQVER